MEKTGAGRISGGTELKITVRTNSSRPGVEELEDGSLKVFVSASPEKGKANKEALKLIAGHLGVPRGRVSIARGVTSRDKMVIVYD